jgi:hypothetical protein
LAFVYLKVQVVYPLTSAVCSSILQQDKP